MNLLANPSFESSLTCWTGSHASLSRTAIANAPDGGYVALVSHTNSSLYGIHGSPCPVGGLAAGTYRATGYVEAASAAAVGERVYLHLSEQTASGATVADTSSAAAALSSAAFAALTVQAPLQSSADSLTVYLQVRRAASGDAFYTDAESLVLTTAATVGAASVLDIPVAPPYWPAALLVALSVRALVRRLAGRRGR